MRFVAGIDGGQSETKAVIVDESGRIVGRGTAGPADHVGEPAGSMRCARACAAAFSAALKDSGLSALTQVEAIVAGISGYGDDFDGAIPELATAHFRFEHDLPIALTGALSTRPAVLLLSGTGSGAFGDDGAGTTVRTGGWGYLFGDEGSAFAIARDALATVMQADDRGESGAFADAALPFFGVPDVRTLASLAVSGRITRPVIASFAPRVHDAAAAGDADGLRIIADAADALASLAALTIARLNLREGPVAIALSGGSFADAGFTELVRARVRVHVPHARIVVAAHDAAVGAALLAFDDAGLVRPTILAP